MGTDRTTRGGPPERIGDLLERMFGDGIAPEGLDELNTAWRDVVGPHAGRHTRIESFRGGTLTIAMDSATVRQELELVGRDEILATLSERLGSGPLVRELRFRVV